MTEDVELREQDKWLPIANVYRIMKNALPKNAKVSKEAKECVQECVSEFVSFITSEASEKCSAEKRKTVNGEDVLFAMASLGFENYAEVLKIYLTKYREYQNSRDRAKRISGGSNGMLLDDEDTKDNIDAGNTSAMSDMSALGSLGGRPASPTLGADASLLRNDVSAVQEQHNQQRAPVDQSPKQSESGEPGEGGPGGNPDNLVDYQEEPIYEDFQIE